MRGQERIFLTPSEVAARYNGAISVRTLANWRSAGVSPPFTKVGGRIMYRLADIEEWERRRTVECTSQYRRD